MITAQPLPTIGNSPVGTFEISGVESIAQLRAINTGTTDPTLATVNPLLGAGTFANVLGYFSKNDGGAATYYFDPYSTATDDGGLTIAPTLGRGRWLRSNTGGNVSVKSFGAVGNGVIDDTAAITAAFNYCAVSTASALAGDADSALGVRQLFFPAGDYIFNGPSLDRAAGLAIAIVGEGKEHTRIRISTSHHFLRTTGTVYSLTIKGIHFYGGKGIWKQSYTGVNVEGHFDIRDNIFAAYTEAAISSLAADMPYFMIEGNEFYGTLASKGIALGGQNDHSTIRNNSFLNGLYSIKLAYAGHRVLIENNDFVRFVSGGNAPKLTDIWIVPLADPVLAGHGLQIKGNMFGNENISTRDYRILIADEAAGTDFSTNNHATTVSTAYAQGMTVTQNNIACGNGFLNGFVYSYTKLLFDYLIAENVWFGGFPVGQVQFDAAVTYANDDRLGDLNIIRLSQFAQGSEFAVPPAVSKPGSAIIIDPLGFNQGNLDTITHFQSGFDPGFVNFGASELDTAAMGNGGVTSINAATDSLGGANASRVVYSNTTGYAYVTAALTNVTIGRRAWVEVEIKRAASNPLDNIKIQFGDNASNIAVVRFVNVPAAGWQVVRIPFVPRQSGVALSVLVFASGYSAGTKEQVQIGRVRVYHASQPVNPGSVFLENKGTFDPPSLADGAGTSTTITVTGAALGDFVLPSFSLDLQGIILTAYVSAANTVTFRFQNESGGVLDLASGVIRARVLKPTY